jgi:GNAT superfamily N-acetyltransferase
MTMSPATEATVAGRRLVEVRRLDAFDDGACAAAYAVEEASHLQDRPWDDHDGYDATVLHWRYDDPAEPMEMWAAYDAGECAAVLHVWFPQDDNTDKLWAALAVHPDHRRGGLGTALIQVLERRARENGRRELMLDSFVPPEASGDHPHERFAAARGFVLESTDKARFLDLPVAETLLDKMAEAARSRWADAYAVETYVDALPDELVPGYCRVSNLLAVDAPSGAVEYEEESLTPQRYQAYLDLERRQGRMRLTTVAVTKEQREVVGYTDLVLPGGAPTKVWQWGTLVDRAHRGHRLGTAIKVENLRRLQRDHPERTVVGTGNDETNSFMVDINVRLGFRIVELCRMYRKVLPDRD